MQFVQGKTYESKSGRKLSVAHFEDAESLGVDPMLVLTAMEAPDAPRDPSTPVGVGIDVSQAEQLATELSEWAYARRVDAALRAGSDGSKVRRVLS